MHPDKPLSRRGYARAGLWFGRASAAALLVFVANVVMASLGFRYGWQPPMQLDRVHEFLLLLAVAVLAVTAALCRERARDEDEEHDQQQSS